MSDSDDQDDKTRIRKPFSPKQKAGKPDDAAKKIGANNNSLSDEQKRQALKIRQAQAAAKRDDLIKKKKSPLKAKPQEPDLAPTELDAVDDTTVFGVSKVGDAAAAKQTIKQSIKQQSPANPTAPRAGELRKTIPPAELDKTQIDVNPSDTLKNRFILERVLGAGGMGVVYKAKDLLKVEAHDRDPYVAIKVLGEEFKSHPEAFIALQRESRKTQRIAHPNIVNVYDFDKDGDTVFMTMEFLEGTPLDKMIKKHRGQGLPRQEVWPLLGGLCSALSYAHEQNIIHSDLKPGNIFVTHLGVTKVFDFGIARAVAKAEQEGGEVEDRTVFDAGNLGALTPAYASLEMLEGDPPDVRDDIYALGCIAYELFTGEHPFKRKNAQDALRRNMKAARIEGISKSQWKVIEHALAFEREDRIKTVKEFWSQLNKKHSRPTGLFAGLAASALIAGGVWAYDKFQTPPPPPEPTFTEDMYRSELEQQIRLELVQSNLAKLYADTRMNTAWEVDLKEQLNELSALTGSSAPEIDEAKQTIVGLYQSAIDQALVNNELAQAKALAQSGLQFSPSSQTFKNTIDEVQQKLAELEQQQAAAAAARQAQLKQQQAAKQQQQAQAAQQRQFEQALSAVQLQLKCDRLLDMEAMSVSVNAMRQADLTGYRKLEGDITRELATCISTMARNFPDRAKAFKSQALNIFNQNANIAAIRFPSKDPCRASLAGLGSRGKRGSCVDDMQMGEKAPRMVVIPSRGSVATFAIGRYEVTVEDFNLFCSQSDKCSLLAQANTSLPATGISIELVNSYIAWLNEQTGKTYRLPSLFEWQYAARAKGRGLDANRNCTFKSRGIELGGALVNASIGQQNGWGLVNYVGNAMEWVMGRGEDLLAVGGSYDTPMEECTIEHSIKSGGDARKDIGFRLVREVSPEN